MDKPTKDKGQSIGGLILLILKMSAASGIAWELAKLAGSRHPYLAPLSVILCVQTTLVQSIRFSFHRLLGTVVGVGLTVWAAAYVPLTGWTLALLLVLVSGIALLLERKETVIHEVALSVLLVFALQQQSGHYGMDRIRDTFIGIAVGLAVHLLVFPPNLIKQAERAVGALMNRLTERFAESAAWVQSGCQVNRETALHAAARTFQKELFQAEKKMEKAAESIKFNIFARSSRSVLQSNRDRLALIKRGAAYLERTMNVLSEWSRTGTLPGDEQSRWVSRLSSLGGYWRERSSIKPAEPHAPVPDTLAAQIAPDDPLRYSAVLETETSELLRKLQQPPSIRHP